MSLFDLGVISQLDTTLKPWELYNYVPRFIMRLMVAFGGLFGILHLDLKNNFGSRSTFLCGIWTKKS